MFDEEARVAELFDLAELINDGNWHRLENNVGEL